MANTLYNVSRGQFLEGQIQWTVDDLKVALIKSGTYNFTAGMATVADIPSADRTFATHMALPARVVTSDGAADADDVTFSTVTSGYQIVAILIYKDNGTPETSIPIAWLDTATGLPITSNGGDIIITWDNGINRIFRL